MTIFPGLVRPGDTLIVSILEVLDDARREELVASIREHIPESVKVLFLEGITGVAVYRPDAEAAA